MKIYAIRDRLINYYMTPFAAPGDKDVLSSLAQTINLGDPTNVPIANAPHHYEIWILGEVNEDSGQITPKLEFLADASSLIRADRGTPGSRAGKSETAAHSSQRTSTGSPSDPKAPDGPTPGTLAADELTPHQAHS